MNIDSYLGAYLDKRMKSIIEEWQLSTKSDLKDLVNRFESAQKEVANLKNFEHEVDRQLTNMEARVRLLRENKK